MALESIKVMDMLVLVAEVGMEDAVLYQTALVMMIEVAVEVLVLY